MGKFILFIGRLLNLYLYFIIGACVLSWVPNINPDYPMFALIFKLAGAGIIPPVLGFDVGPAIVMAVIALAWSGLEKIYKKYYAPKEPQVIVITKEELMQKISEQNNNSEGEDNNGD